MIPERGKAITRALAAGLAWSTISGANTIVLLQGLPFETDNVRLGANIGVSLWLGIRGLTNIVKSGALLMNPQGYYEKTDKIRKIPVVKYLIPRNTRRLPHTSSVFSKQPSEIS